MNCHECRELVVAHVEGMLDAQAARTISEHVSGCADCRADLQGLSRLHERLDRYKACVERTHLEEHLMSRIRGAEVPMRAQTAFARRHAGMGLGLAAAVALIVGVVAILWTPSGAHSRGIVLAEVINHMRSAHTVMCKTSFYSGEQLAGTAEHMYKGDSLRRIVSSEGHIYIQDTARGKTLALNSNKRTATVLDTVPTTFDFYKFITEFQDGTEELIGEEVIDGRPAIGFIIRPLGKNTTIWVDAETRLPIQIREETPDRNGDPLTVVTTDFVFDAPLDDALFSLELPDGYTVGDVESRAIDRTKQLALYTRSAAAANRIVKACIRFADDHEGQWPTDLAALEDYGIDAEALVNPRQPDLAVGWVYSRPAADKEELTDPAETILIYEVFDEWDEGVNVGFADGRVQFIKDPDRFRRLQEDRRDP